MKLRCPNCKTVFTATIMQRGTIVSCPNCQKQNKINGHPPGSVVEQSRVVYVGVSIGKVEKIKVASEQTEQKSSGCGCGK